jgi:hypothetical protein
MGTSFLKKPTEGEFFAVRFYGCFDKEIHKYVVHCLELDLVADGSSVEEAESNLIDTVKAHLDFAIRNNNWGNVFHPAPPEIWAKFAKMAYKKTGKKKAVQAERIEYSTKKTPSLELQSVYA